MKPIGPTWSSEAVAAGLAGHAWGADGLIEVHDQQNRLVKIWKEDAGAVQESRMADVGSHPQLTESQITAIKTFLATHDHTKPAPKPQRDVDLEDLKAHLADMAADPLLGPKLRGLAAKLNKVS